jgi:hypothetical protein
VKHTRLVARGATFDDGTHWALPEVHDDNAHGVEWKLRYAPNQLTREDQLYLAGVLASYGSLLMLATKDGRERLAALKRAHVDGRSAEQASGDGGVKT